LLVNKKLIKNLKKPVIKMHKIHEKYKGEVEKITRQENSGKGCGIGCVVNAKAKYPFFCGSPIVLSM
jgi:hypothetical protein